jgi:hypothetical protein
LVAVQRFAVQLLQARCTERLQNNLDLAREAVGWNGVFGGRPIMAFICSEQRLFLLLHW